MYGAFMQIYLRGDNDWRQRTPWEEAQARGVPEALLAVEGVDIVAGQMADGRVRVASATGQGTISWRNGCGSYAFRGVDPLGCGSFDDLEDEAILRLSFNSTHPDAPQQLSQIFRAERSGDIMVSAKRGYDLRARWEIPEHRSTHGALVPAQMHVPVIIGAPVAANNFRTADVFPTVLRLMGREPAEGIDGVARD